jgi:hypothetical protein
MSLLDSDGLIELKRARARDYSRIFLTKNPFPATPIPDFPFITVDREEIIGHFQDIIANAYEDSRITVTVIVGDYGYGKSHLLKLFKRSVNEKLMTTDHSCLAVYVRTPGKDVSDFLFNFLDDLSVATVTNLSKRLVGEFLKKNPKRLLDFLVDRKAEKKIDEWLKDPSQFVINSTYIDLFKAIRDSYLTSVGNSNALLAFVSLAHPDLNSTAWRWFLGGNLNKDERGLIRVETNISDDRTAFSVFEALLRLLKSCGVASTVVLVDEFEKVVELGSTARTDYQDDLRQIIDDNPTGMNMFFAIAIKQHHELSSERSAFARRLAGDVHKLKSFNVDQSAIIVHEFLRSARPASFKESDVSKQYPKYDPEIFPFTKAAIRTIRDGTDGNVSYLLLACRRCVEYLMENRLDSVDDKVVEAVSKRYGGLK